MTAPARIEIRDGHLEHPQIIALLDLHARGMLDNTPPEAAHFLDISALKRSDISLLSAWDEDKLCGIGALKDLGDQSGEVKSMRTTDDRMGRGIGTAILHRIIDIARARGYHKLWIETGTGPAFDAAHRLYIRNGFVPCPPFGGYVDSPFNRFYSFYLG